MAFITLAGTLRDPTSELAVGDQIRFTHKSTTGETVEGAVSVLTIDPSGTYSKDLQYGLVLVEYKDVRTSQFKNIGVATVNGSNPATSIPELLNALVPVSSAELIEFQAILADAVTARNEAEAFAASIDLINDLSQAYIFDTVADYKSSAIVFPVGKVIRLLDRAFDFTKITGIVSANDKNIIANTAGTSSIVEIDTRLKAQMREHYPVLSTVTTIKLFVADVSDTSFRVYFKQDGVDSFLLLNEVSDFTVNNITNAVTFITGFAGAGTLYFYDRKDQRQTAFSAQATFMGNVDAGIQNLHAKAFDARPFVYAHRCYSSMLPQNTILAASMCLLDKFDALEVDAQPSIDGTLYLFHDITVDALTNGTGTFNQLTDTYINTLKFTSLAGSPYANEPISTLESYLDFISENHIQSAIEIKQKNTDVDVVNFVNQIIAAGCEDLVVFNTAFITDCVIARDITKRMRVSVFSASKADCLSKVDQLASMLPAELWIEQSLTVDRDILDKANEKGVLVGVWTINSKREAQKALRAGYNRMVSNVFLGDWA